MYYLSIIDNKIGFKISDIHTILESDISISDEIYTRFFDEQKIGKQFRILDINGLTFEEIFEEYTPDPIPIEKSLVEILQDRVVALEIDKVNLQNELDQAKNDNLTTMVALADVYEQLLAL